MAGDNWKEVPLEDDSSGNWKEVPLNDHDVVTNYISTKGKSTYDDVPESEFDLSGLNLINPKHLVRSAERGLVRAGAIQPGMEIFSPSAISEKKKSVMTGLNDVMLNSLPNAVAASSAFAAGAPYTETRDKVRDYLDSVKGGTKAVGHALGFLPALAVPSSPVKQGTSALKSFVKTVATGAGVGALANPGDVKGEITPLQLPERLQNAKYGALFSGALAAPGTAIRFLREKLAAEPSLSADEVIKIAKSMGLAEDQIPTELLTSDQVVRDKAAALKRDPSIGGSMVRKNLQPFQDKIQENAEGLVAGAHPSTETGATVGMRVREQIPQAVEEKLAPARQAYEELEGPMSKAEPAQQAMKAGTTKMTDDLAARDPDGSLRRIVAQQRDHFLENINTVEDLKRYRTEVGKMATDARSKGDGRVAELYDNLYDVLTRERDRSLEKSILTSGRKIGAEARAQQTVDKLRAADQLYGETIGNTLEALGVEPRRSQPPMQTVKDYLQSKPVDSLPDALWAGKDSEQAAKFQQQFPNQAEDIRKLQLQRLQAGASKGPELNPVSLDNQLQKMTPETQNRLLGDQASVLPEQRTLLKAMPDPNFNPSHTSVRQGTLDNTIFHPIQQGHSVLNAAELNLRRPLQYTQEGGIASLLARGANKTAALQQQTRQSMHSPETILPKVQGTKFEAPLQAAAQRGADSFAVTYYEMSQVSPEFQKILRDAENAQSR